MTRRLPVAPSKPAYLRGVDSSVAAILVKGGADKNLKSKEGNTPMDVAVQQKKQSVIDYFNGK